MRSINFVILFVFCLALIVFVVENTQPATVQIARGIQFEAPLGLELFLAMGSGAVLAWLFSTWTRLLQFVASFKDRRKIRKQEARIQKLEQEVERYELELQQQQPLLPPAPEPLTSEAYLTEKA